MYKNDLVEWLKSSGKLTFTTNDASKALSLKGPSLTRLLSSVARQGIIRKIARSYYYYTSAPVRDIFAIASKIVYPSYIATESAFERYGLSNIIPSIIRVIVTKPHRPVMLNDAKVVFIKFKKENFFGYNESRWISISTVEKAFVDSLYLGEFPFFTDLVGYYKKLESYGHTFNIEKFIGFALRMDSKALINKAGFFLDYIGNGAPAERLHQRIYKKGFVKIDRSGSIFESRKWMIE
ncbi:hypothetical protein B2A_09376 [mine drainage metagenome]|uniref:Transcriptional regulator n=1 Tax=mine drainage metagenome TaxID=410659 RepID=T0ZKJ0_9ZZZZ